MFLGSAVINQRQVISVPINVRDKLKADKGDTLNFFFIDGQIVIDKNIPPEKPNGGKK